MRGRSEGRSETEGQEVLVVAHCRLNPHTRVRGLSPVPPLEAGGPVIQLPCPEALYMGPDRWAVTRNQLDVPEFRRFCRSLITYHADLIEMMASKGFRIKVLGMAGSPSCGVQTTSAGYTGGRPVNQAHSHVPGPGIFMEELFGELNRRGVRFETEEADC